MTIDIIWIVTGISNFFKYVELLEYLGLRKGKDHNYKLNLLGYLADNDFLIKNEADSTELDGLNIRFGIPTSSWHDIIKDLERSKFIIVRRKNKFVAIRMRSHMIYEIQLTTKGSKFLTRFRHAYKRADPSELF